MTTIQDYFEQARQIKASSLPPALKEGFEFVKELTENYSTWDYYHADKDIKKTVDNYLVKFSAFWDKQNRDKQQNNKKDEEQKARELAKGLIRAYVRQGASVEHLKQSFLGSAGDEGMADIRGGKINVTRIAKKAVAYAFPLVSIYNEVAEEAPAKKTAAKPAPVPAPAPAPKRVAAGTKAAKELAIRLLSPFVLRGDAVRSMGVGKLSGSNAQNTVYLDAPKDIVEVSVLGGKKVNVVFSLKALCNEIREANTEKVELVSDSVRFIKRYALLHGRQKTDTQILAFINSLQKAILERRIRKTDPYAKEINYIQDTLVKVYNKMQPGVADLFKVKGDVLEAFRTIGGSQQQRLSVAYIKRYIGMQGKGIDKEKAEQLFRLIKGAMEQHKVNANDPYKNKLKDVLDALKHFIDNAKPHDTLAIHEAVLNGINEALDGCCSACEQHKPCTGGKGLNGIGVPDSGAVQQPGWEQGGNPILNSMDFASFRFATLGFKGKWKDFIGDPAPGFTAMISAQPKMGKSYLCAEFAGYLARNHGKTLFVAAEEKLGSTLQKKIESVQHSELDVTAALPDDLSPYEFIILDSVTRLGLQTEDLRRLKALYPDKSFIYVYQVTKDGKFRGTNDAAHDVDVVIRIPERGKAVQFGRYNQGGEMDIFDMPLAA